MKLYKILFFGTPEFALPSLKALIETPNEILGVVTQPDRPKGRGRKLTPPPIKVLAQKHNLPIYQPEAVRDKVFLKEVQQLKPDLLVVVAFGQFLPKALLEIPPLGGINVHPSLLPKYRGAAPINWAIINGETITGISIIKVSLQMDSGDILFQKAISIEPDETAGELHDKLATLGAEALLETIRQMQSGTIISIPQDDRLATYAPKLKREDGYIHWDKPAINIANLIRGLAPFPGAYTYLDGKLLKLFRPKTISTSVEAPPGTIVEATHDGLKISTGQGVLLIKEVQLQGKRRLPVKEFIKGHPDLKGKKLG
ncbi:MAG TPA: methionyl-tRNA formyltransferase [Candidatus Desulfofervidus auxilii]|nr:methionyl-tRNA formyltransferase [Candidatus Desulfofervidus auxilii]